MNEFQYTTEKFVPYGPINNIPALIQIMAWHRQGDKSLVIIWTKGWSYYWRIYPLLGMHELIYLMYWLNHMPSKSYKPMLLDNCLQFQKTLELSEEGFVWQFWSTYSVSHSTKLYVFPD